MSNNLFDDSDDNSNEENFRLNTNEVYANTYNNLRKKELLQKFKDKGLDASESDSDDSDSSDEDEILDVTFDQDFLKTLASLKSKDPTIYDKNIKFFNSGANDDDCADVKCNINKKPRSKPVTLKDYERKVILEKNGKFSDDSDQEDDKQTFRILSPTLVEEERLLKDEFKKVINQDNDSGDDEFGGIFKKREKTKADNDREEEDYLKWLAGKNESIEEDVKKKLNPLKNYWSNDKLPSSEKFLRDYVLNKGYIEASNYNEIPTYEDIVEDQAPLSEDEQELEKQAEFEQKYNFRYEEPDHEFIKRYPRAIETSLRLSDEKRKQKRHETKERKLQEKQQKLKELEMIKEIKRKEILEKIEKLKMVTGNDELGFKDEDLEADFDPDAHDRRMQELFNDDYYQVDEGEEKPECPSDIEELKIEDWDNFDPQKDEVPYDYYDNEPHCEDDDFNMDCDYNPVKAKQEFQHELINNTRKRRGGRQGRRNRFMEVIKSEKPPFNPEDEKTYGEYIDEYYKLDCEDIIGETPCRFKYVETTPNDFGLTIEEILLAKNKELNQWASLKKAIQIRPNHVEKKEQRLYKLKSKNEELKRKIFKSLYGEESDNENEILKKDQTVSNKKTKDDKNNATFMEGESKKAKKRRKRKITAENGQHLHPYNCRENEQVIEAAPAKKTKTKAPVDISSNNNELTETKDVDKNKNQNACVTTNEETKILDTSTTLVTKIDNKNPLTKGFPKESSNNVDKRIFTASKKPQKISKLETKHNPFSKVTSKSVNLTKDVALGSLPPLRNNLPKIKISKAKLKSKLENKKRFNGKLKKRVENNDISDERLKAYGINPKKFHKKQKYKC